MSSGEMLEAMEDCYQPLDFLTGMKQRLISHGWSNDAAEQLVITISARAGK